METLYTYMHHKAGVGIASTAGVHMQAHNINNLTARPDGPPITYRVSRQNAHAQLHSMINATSAVGAVNRHASTEAVPTICLS